MSEALLDTAARELAVDYARGPSLIRLAVRRTTRRAGIVRIDPARIRRVHVLDQEKEYRNIGGRMRVVSNGEQRITGYEYLRRLKERKLKVCDVRVMEEFLKPHNRELIPEEWGKGITYFFGTIFRGPNDREYVAYMRRFGKEYQGYYCYLGNDFAVHELAACFG